MIYRFLKRIVKICLAVFFRKIVVNGRENLPNQGPLLLLANHPNTFMDPLIIAAIAKQRVGFMANASIFSSPFMVKFFTFFHVIPVYRQKDIAPGEKPDNQKTFARSIDYLNQNGTFLIFPEGNSYYELKLRKIKTGSARIALSYEEAHQFNSDLQICTVALDYSDALQFRSMVAVTFNPAFKINDYKEQYHNDEFAAVKDLTHKIRKDLAQHVTHTEEKDQEEYLLRAHQFYATFVDEEADLYKNPKRSLEVRLELSRALRYLKRKDESLYNDLEHDLQTFFMRLKKEDLSLGLFSDEFLKQNPFVVYFRYLFEFFLLGPIYLFGLITNYLPYILPSKIFNAMRTDIEYKTSVQMVAGLLTFPIFYFIEVQIFRHYVSTNVWLSLLLTAFLAISGYITMYYYTEMKRFMRVIHYYGFMQTDRKQKLMDLRDKILAKIKTARDLMQD